MEFIRVYLQNDGRVKRGAVSHKETGKLVPDKQRQIWFNFVTGMICQIDQEGVSFYHCTKIQGDETFSVRLFKDYFERKSVDELTGFASEKIEFENKKEDTHKMPKEEKRRGRPKNKN